MGRYLRWALIPLLLGILIWGSSQTNYVAAQDDATPTPDPAAEQIVDWRYGVIESYQAPGHARNLGAAWTRFRFQWADVQADGPDSWTTEFSDEDIAGQIEASRLIVGLIIGVPEWARDENKLPSGLYLPIDDPDNTWAVFVRNIVGRYAGQIDHWVIWNEPDIWDSNALGHTWDGDEADFAQLMRVAYLVAKETNPDSVIHLPAFTYFWDANYGRDQYIGRLFDVILEDPDAAANNYYFDVMTAHLYFNPDQIYNVISEFNAIRAEKGLPHKPIWLMETNSPPVDDPIWPVEDVTLRVSQGEQAFFMPQMVVAALAAGAERIGVYKLKDIPSDRGANPEPFGLIRDDGTRRPAFNAYRTAMEFLSGVESTTIERWDGVGQVRIDQADRTTTVLFARLPADQTTTVTAIAESAFLVDTYNVRRIFVEPVDGVFTVELPAALCSQSIGDYCMIGGETYYLVQSADGGPPPVAPIDGAALAPTSTPAPTATATAIPSPTSIASPTPIPTETVAVEAPDEQVEDGATMTPAGTQIAAVSPESSAANVEESDVEEAATRAPGSDQVDSENNEFFGLKLEPSILIALAITLISSILLLVGIYKRMRS